VSVNEWEIALERTFLAIKPDGVQRGLVGEIIRRFEAKGFYLGWQFMMVSRELAEQHYDVHRENRFLLGWLSSLPLDRLAMVWEGEASSRHGK